MWTFAVYTGVRHGELAALAWEDIDWEKGTAHIQRNLNALGMFNPPKTDAGDRVITLLEPALEALKAQRTLTSLHLKPRLSFITGVWRDGISKPAICFHAGCARRTESLLLFIEYRLQIAQL
jgi:integrase